LERKAAERRIVYNVKRREYFADILENEELVAPIAPPLPDITMVPLPGDGRIPAPPNPPPNGFALQGNRVVHGPAVNYLECEDPLGRRPPFPRPLNGPIPMLMLVNDELVPVRAPVDIHIPGQDMVAKGTYADWSHGHCALPLPPGSE
jgi:hypothetical protein